ncbi:MAG: DUF4184 family protein [Propionibacterium sp.]|nr:DUF4184 family protein [Propionibacterium sp.]
MSFTPAHPTFVLTSWRLGLPVFALVIGSMVPDAPMYVGALVAVAGGYARLRGTVPLQVAFTPATAGGGLMLVTAMVVAAGWRSVTRTKHEHTDTHSNEKLPAIR